MNHFITDADRREIHADWWAEGEFVTIKLFSYVDKQRIWERSLVGLPERDADGNTRFRMDSALHAEVTLVMGIVDWTFTDDGDVPVPCTSDKKCALSDADGRFIFREIQAYNEERSAEAQESFRAGSGSGTEE